jgi:hypothetical protein
LLLRHLLPQPQRLLLPPHQLPLLQRLLQQLRLPAQK